MKTKKMQGNPAENKRQPGEAGPPTAEAGGDATRRARAQGIGRVDHRGIRSDRDLVHKPIVNGKPY